MPRNTLNPDNLAPTVNNLKLADDRTRAIPAAYLNQDHIVDIHLTTKTAPDVKSAVALIHAALCVDGITEARVHIPGGVKTTIDLKTLCRILKSLNAYPTMTFDRSKITCRPNNLLNLPPGK